ncbi:sigma-70 family RNA polymerase sigma factor [Acetivibrio cellulolyticus]|uniref:sigma-70 family RNA polymerase sigma factor n=1 Tax=Acetivibrio cellulolyticus TaxID=35830 RepID=UPI0001E2C1D7|nr:sigma-70 family RNA polymerase sigma factor [Acetivibrio cellulolyticus]
MRNTKITDINGAYSEDAEKFEFASNLKMIKEGNQQVREEFIEKYKPFILRVTSMTLNKYVEAHRSDEFSIALSAFNEAVDRFNSGSRNKFLSYAEKVIRSRIIDYLRKGKSDSQHESWSLDSSNGLEFGEVYQASDSYSQFESIEDREEIEELTKKLMEFGITLDELVLSTPRHKDTRELCISIAEILLEDKPMLEFLHKSKSIPRIELAEKAHVHENTIGKNRKYIIAVCLILTSDLNISKRVLKYECK